MYLAQEFDAEQDGVPFLSPRRLRLIAPDLRSRMAGYLATAPLVADGFRTDGVWVWPSSLADHARDTGAMPQAQLFEHMRGNWFLLPDELPQSTLDEAARAVGGPVTPDPPDYEESTYYAEREPGSDKEFLFWHYKREDGGVYEGTYTRDLWSRRTSMTKNATRTDRYRREYRPITEFDAARMMDENSQASYRLAIKDVAETTPIGEWRSARVWDGASPDGSAWFSPGRLRIPEPVRRQRLANYLASGQPVIRVNGEAADPLSKDDEPVLPLNYRTDGVWIWQEALAYYVLHRGLAPEMEFLCHIEERGYRLPDAVPEELVAEAGQLALSAVKRADPGEPFTYYRVGARVLRARGDQPYLVDALGRDLRWTASDRLWRARYGDDDDDLPNMSEVDTVRLIDDLWARNEAVPPLLYS